MIELSLKTTLKVQQTRPGRLTSTILPFPRISICSTPEFRANPSSIPVSCLRLLRRVGLLLTRVSDGRDRRVGTFRDKGFVSYDGEERRVAWRDVLVGFQTQKLRYYKVVVIHVL
jgi:hypothetical protein